MRASELTPAVVFIFRTKGKFWQPPLAQYLGDVLECVTDEVFLFDRFVLRKFTQTSPLAAVFCHLQRREVAELRSVCSFSHRELTTAWCLSSPGSVGYPRSRATSFSDPSALDCLRVNTECIDSIRDLITCLTSSP